MDLLCGIIGLHTGANNSKDTGELFLQGNSTQDTDTGQDVMDKDPLWFAQKYIRRVIIPGICIFGMFGNVLNLVVFSLHFTKGSLLNMEKSSTVGLLALALAEFLFCCMTTIISWHKEHQAIRLDKDLGYYSEIYGPFLINVLMKISVWTTVVMAIGRYAAVCHPIITRQHNKVKHTVLSIIATWIIWPVLHIPLLWTFNVKEIECGETSFYFLDIGRYSTDETLARACTYMWSVLGFFIPVVILSFCNICLINALRKSRSMQVQLRANQPPHVPQNRTSQRITFTLIVVIVAYFMCMCPSEFLHFYMEVNDNPNWGKNSLSLTIMCTNVLQALNFSFNFVLYAIINTHYRKIIYSCFCFSQRKEKARSTGRKRADSKFSQSLYTTQNTSIRFM